MNAPDRYVVRFPSGRVLQIIGRFVLLGLDGELAPAILPPAFMDDGNAVNIVDPRAVIRNSAGQLVYEPRPFAHLFLPEMADWLRDHPDWPPPGDRLAG